ncbi:hypothetical protein CKM354_000514100 [Cercospora kikuchii]|uniref:Uncharacterized protein n=1 Tax=Cercospora kikuchii TaxID=84275 RepID=A0A9P3FF98_9PEZI|nr:uncharacterized protein CKM354_000514100 [Cercospora kikuchii]GIZ41852.1 hypothetical protein CKM354_000514100 [Cercospora kikuchii]
MLSTILTTVLALASFAPAAKSQTTWRIITQYQGSGCTGSSISCNQINSGVCCGSNSRRFDSTRLTGPTARSTDEVFIYLPSGGSSTCGTFTQFIRGSRCVGEGPGGASGTRWYDQSLARRDVAEPSEEECQKPDELTFADGVSLDLTGLSDAEEEELFAFVDAGGESGELPNHFVKFVK